MRSFYPAILLLGVIIITLFGIRSCMIYEQPKIIDNVIAPTKIKILKFSPPPGFELDYQIVDTGEIVNFYMKRCSNYKPENDNIIPRDTYNVNLIYTVYQKSDGSTYKIRSNACSLMDQLPLITAA